MIEALGYQPCQFLPEGLKKKKIIIIFITYSHHNLVVALTRTSTRHLQKQKNGPEAKDSQYNSPVPPH